MARTKDELFADLVGGRQPRHGSFDANALQEARKRATPQMGATRFSPTAIFFEFPFVAPGAAATVITVEVPAPERIVFMPVPDWVIESIWQGEIDGSYHFASDAERLLEQFRLELGEESNRRWFGPKAPRRRE